MYVRILTVFEPRGFEDIVRYFEALLCSYSLSFSDRWEGRRCSYCNATRHLNIYSTLLPHFLYA